MRNQAPWSNIDRSRQGVPPDPSLPPAPQGYFDRAGTWHVLVVGPANPDLSAAEQLLTSVAGR